MKVNIHRKNYKSDDEYKWFWKTEWCKLNKVSPFSNFWWNDANKEFYKEQFEKEK